MNKPLKLITNVVLAILMTACSKDDGPAIQKSDAKQITSFMFKAADNDNLDVDIAAVLDQEEGIITATMPIGTVITALVPHIEISTKASLSLTGVQDFSNQKTYTVTAEDGTTKTYSVTVDVTKSNEKLLLMLAFRAEDNSALDEDIETTIDNESREVVGFVREGTELTVLLPLIEVSPRATVVPEGAQDFSEPVTYTVTAEDGSTAEYEVILESLTDRRILLRLYEVNPDNTLSWDVTATDITTWDGIRITAEGSVNYVFLSGKNIDSIPAEFGYLESLEDLSLSPNKIRIVPPQIGGLSNLKKLSISGNEIKVLPPEIGQLNNLEFLSIGSNELNTLPAEIGQLTNLRELRAAENNLSALPAEFSSLANLQTLNLQFNNLGTVPLPIGGLISLESLNLSNNEIASASSFMAQLPNIKQINLSQNGLNELPPFILELSNLEVLNMTDTGLSTLPDGFWQLEQLRILFLGSNNLIEMPGAIGLLENLTALSWAANNLSTVPRELWELTDLTILNLGNNELEAIPTNVEQLVKLNSLSLNNNELTFIPAELANLQELSNLLLAGNNIRILPGVICAMDISNGGTTEIDIVPGGACLTFVED